MNIYIDESGSINNWCNSNKYFVIALIHVLDKRGLKSAFKRFISANLEELKFLDQEKINPTTSKILKPGGRMFLDNKFVELKGSQLNKHFKSKFVNHFLKKPHFEIYYIKIVNSRLTDTFCQNTARVFNYTIRLALEYYITNGYLPDEKCNLQLDERNEKTNTRYFLENYLNTELMLSGKINNEFTVTYFDSANNSFIQLADVFANLLYSHLLTNNYSEELNKLKDAGILKHVFLFPPI